MMHANYDVGQFTSFKFTQNIAQIVLFDLAINAKKASVLTFHVNKIHVS